MWTVESESGRLRAVLVQESIEQFWEGKLPFVGIESSTHYLARCPHADIDGGRGQWEQLPRFLREEGVRVFELTAMLERALEGATVEERRRMVEEVWEGMPAAPDPEKLSIEYLLWGYPARPHYDEEADRVVLPDFQRVGWPYPRDTSFTTQLGTVICNMRRYSRRFEPRVVKLAYEYDPALAENTEVVWDANDSEDAHTEPPCVEGGDVHIVDEETIAIGVGQRSTYTGFMEAARRLFELDGDGEIRQICAVRLPDYPAVDYMHLDVVINYPDRGKALVMPYFFESEVVRDMPRKGLLLKTLEAVRAQSERVGRPMAPVVHPDAFREAGSCYVYEKSGREPRLAKRRPSLVDFLVEEGKLEADGIVYVGGRPRVEYDVEHLMLALMEQARGASNIVTIKPGLVIAYERNHATNDELREHGIRVKEWDDSYLDMLGGPHCSTSPLWRDPP
ncbi:MAG: arginine deiminase family protein [Candidatus Bathyarchaeota archaeon]|nr:arginine deiminase family protein [Candidatus Bathyarchaeota archaeon]